MSTLFLYVKSSFDCYVYFGNPCPLAFPMQNWCQTYSLSPPTGNSQVRGGGGLGLRSAIETTPQLAQKPVFCNSDLDKSITVCKMGDLKVFPKPFQTWKINSRP